MSHQKFYITKRSNGFFYIGWREENGRRCWKSTKCTRRFDALQFLGNFQRKMEVEHVTSAILLSRFFSDIFTPEHGTALRKTTMQTYQLAVRTFIATCGDRHIHTYTPDNVEEFKQKRLLAKATPAATNVYLRNLMAVFSFAVKKELLPKNIFHMSQLFKLPKQPPSYIQREDFSKLIEHTNKQLLKDVFTFAAATGLRSGEIQNLKWQNVDLPRRQISIVNSEEFTTKSGKSRVVPLNDTAITVLQTRQQRAVKEYIFHKNGFKLGRTYLSHSFKASIIRAGLPEHLRFHSLRHTFGSWCAQMNVPIYTIQALMGHADVQTTAIYAHLSESHLHDAVEKISL
jgi:integrase